MFDYMHAWSDGVIDSSTTFVSYVESNTTQQGIKGKKQMHQLLCLVLASAGVWG